MTLPAAAVGRQLRHRRQIDVQVYACGSGRWQVDATVSDVKSHDVALGHLNRAAGEPIHDMLLRLVVDAEFNVLEAGAQTRAMPYVGRCDAHGDAYTRLAGLNLMRDFRQGLRERVGGTLGCTHITELAQVLPTAVLQAFANDAIDPRGTPDGTRPFQLDRCHALRLDAPAVREHYPRWWRPAAAAPVHPVPPEETDR